MHPEQGPRFLRSPVRVLCFPTKHEGSSRSETSAWQWGGVRPLALKEVIEVVGLPLASLIVAKAGDPDQVMLVKSGTVPTSAIRHCNRMLAETRAMIAAGRWS